MNLPLFETYANLLQKEKDLKAAIESLKTQEEEELNQLPGKKFKAKDFTFIISSRKKLCLSGTYQSDGRIFEIIKERGRRKV